MVRLPAHEGLRGFVACSIARVERQAILAGMGAFAVKVSTRAADNEALIRQLNECPCGGVLGAANVLGRVASRESDKAIVTAVVDGSQFEKDAAGHRRERPPCSATEHMMRKRHEALCCASALVIVMSGHEVPYGAPESLKGTYFED